jgi:hypothetical protein
MRNEETQRGRGSGKIRIRITKGCRDRLLLIGGGDKIYKFASSRAVSARPSGKGKLEARYSVGKRRCDRVELTVRVSSQGKADI